MLKTRNGLGVWLERLTTVAVMLVVAGSLYRAFWAPYNGPRLKSFFQLQKVANVLRQESDPVRRENNVDGEIRWLDTMVPTNGRIFVLDMLGPENFDKMAAYYYVTYYFYPREVAISLGQPPAFQLGEATGRKPVSLEEINQAGYDFAVQVKSNGTLSVLPLGSSAPLPPETRSKPIPEGDWLLAFLLPLAAAITGSRMVRWLFRDLKGILTTGELLASGLAVGVFFLTQLTLGLRLAGVRWERILAGMIFVWAVGEWMLLVRRRRIPRPQFKVQYLWWLLLVPAGLILWCQFRLAGLLGIQEFDAVAFWAFKAKILHDWAGKGLWTWFKNPALGYAHLDYPLLVPLLHALTYGALGHVNDFVIKFWNQWMLLLLAWAVLGAGRFPAKSPWLAAAVAMVIVLLPMTREYALMEGGTLPMFFYTVLASMQLAIGMVEQQSGRLRLGLLLLLALVMVKFEGMVFLGFWGILLLLGRDSRAALWPPWRVGWAGVLGLAAWLPYMVFRLNGPVSHPQSGWLGLLIKNAGAVFHILPMTWIAMLSRRLLNNDFADWTSPDNQHAVWQGHWMGWQSLVDQATQGAGWVCLLLLAVAWYRGGRLRWMMVSLFLMFLVYATVLSLVWSTVHSSPLNYTLALDGSGDNLGGRYHYPALMAWFVAGIVLLLRTWPGKPADSNEKETMIGNDTKSCGKQRLSRRSR